MQDVIPVIILQDHGALVEGNNRLHLEAGCLMSPDFTLRCGRGRSAQARTCLNHHIYRQIAGKAA